MTYSHGMSRMATWSALLGKWTEFAQSAVALPTLGEGGRWRRAVPGIITLQANLHALSELSQIEPAEIPAALVRAGKSIEDASIEISEIWAGEPMPPQALEVVDEAKLALRQAETIGWGCSVVSEEFVAKHPADLIAAMLESGIVRDLHVPSPGVPLFETSPAIHLVPTSFELDLDDLADVLDLMMAMLTLEGELAPSGVGTRHQVYRQFDFARGGPVRDVVLPIEGGLAAGQPQLVCAIERGEVMSVSLPPRVRPRLDRLPVMHLESVSDL
ncbi:MAG: hypothetical protein KIT88_09245 [Phycisphaeraceae bacterium]|nr:hypothetical protein [Phycisphaeraceae bacterium]